MGAPSVPTPPDPKVTAAAQTSTNVNTAIANAQLGHTNQVDQYGNRLNYSQTGQTTMTDQQGQTYQLPTWTATQTLSPKEQALLNTNLGTQQNIANIGQQQSKAIGSLLSTPVDLSANNIDKYTNTNYQPGFDRTWNMQQGQLDQKLADQGISTGSTAYNTAQTGFGQSKQLASDQYLNDMYGNAQSAILAQRNQPINEITALMSGSQVSQPNFPNQPSTQLPTVDYAGIVNQNYAQQMQAYQAQLSQSNATMGGLFGLGGSALTGLGMF